jgi:N-carbamoylputrescine amidase
MPEQTPRLARIALIQQADVHADPETNKKALCRVIEEVGTKADFVMPTELSTTQYFGLVRDRSVESWAEELGGPFLSDIRQIAMHRRCTILLPIYLKVEKGRFVNAVVVIGIDGNVIYGQARYRDPVAYYSKVHLPTARRGNEGIDELYYFERGRCFPTFDTPLARIGVLTCYDRRFPEAWRSLALNGAELVFMPSCVPAWNPSSAASTGALFVAELQTRACENGVFVAACNRAGEQVLQNTKAQFIGQSCVIDPAGGLIQMGSATEASVIEIEIDLDKVRRVRRRLTLLEDRQVEAYDLGERWRGSDDHS